MNGAITMENKTLDLRYAIAGWLAIAGAVITIPELLLCILQDIAPGRRAGLLPFIVFLTLARQVCVVYAFYQFKNLLNEYYEFHKTDTLISILIGCGIIITCLALAARINLDLRIPAVILGGVVGIPTGILGIVFGVKLLQLEAPLHGLLKPLAYLNIAGSICFLTFILTPIGLILMIAGEVVLGIVFLKGKEEIELEFV